MPEATSRAMIDLEKRFIFVHIPKTAGSSVTTALGAGWQNHKDIERYRKDLGQETFDEFFKFSIVRNPWARLLSEYCFQTRLFGRRATKLHAYDERGARRSFGDWVRKSFADPFAYQSRIWGGTVSKRIHRWSPQVDWICIDDAIAVDYVGRMENLTQDFGALCERLQLPCPELGWRKKVIHRHYSSYYDDELRDIVGEYYQKDIDAFGYAFERRESPSFWQQMSEMSRSLITRS